MTSLMNMLYHLTLTLGIGSYGLAIILLTIIIKLVLYPLSLKQMKSMTMMQKLAPKIKEIQDKYKGKDPQKMQQKIMELYKEHNVNPAAGCLPLLIQMPILIALYRALLGFKYADPEHASFLWIGNLSNVYHLNQFMSNPTVVLIPLLAGLTTYFQTRMTTNSQDQTQKMMLYTMPVFIAWITTTVPAGLGVYWVTFNLMGIIQQYFVNKHTLAMKEALTEGADNRKNR
ncbi:YidC/Oxa1 family membrane protein insertase [Desulfocucumis palustris]